MNRALTNILIIIPAYNAASRLKILLKQLTCYKDRVLFIDDGSNDKTYEILIRNRFTTLHYDENKGVSFAINQGIKYAYSKGYDSVIIMDADCQHNPQYISYFMEEITENDLVIGNRFCSDGIIPDVKRTSNTFGSCVLEKIFNQFIQDISCGFKAFKLEEDLIKYIEKSTDYSIIFDLLIYSITKKKKITTINMEAIYFPEELWFTRKIEIESLMKSITPFAHNDYLLIDSINQELKQNRSFHINIKEIIFFFFFIEEYDGYFIQADKKVIQNYHSMRENKYVNE